MSNLFKPKNVFISSASLSKNYKMNQLLHKGSNQREANNASIPLWNRRSSILRIIDDNLLRTCLSMNLIKCNERESFYIYIYTSNKKRFLYGIRYSIESKPSHKETTCLIIDL